MNQRIKELGGFAKAAVVEPSAEVLAILSGEDFAGMPVKAEDVHVREMLLCHDQYDRTYERFPKEYLERFAETGPGKSLLACHDTGMAGQMSLPMGRFFQAGVVKKVEEIPVPVQGRRRMRKDAGGYSKAPDIIVPGFESKRKQIHYLDCSYYFANIAENEQLRSNIDLGVFKHVSIGYRYDELACDICKASYFGDCPHIFGWEYQDGEDGDVQLATGTYGGDVQMVEMREGSIVYLGAQQGSRLKSLMAKQVSEGRVNPEALAATPLGEDLVILKEAEQLAREFGHDRRSYALDLESLAKGHVGLSLEDHSNAVLDAAEGLVTRYEGLSDDNARKRPDKATTLPAKHGERLRSLSERLTLLSGKTAALDAADAPVPDADADVVTGEKGGLDYQRAVHQARLRRQRT